MSFKSLFSKVSSKVNLINTTLPGLAEELTNNVNRSLNSIKAEGLANSIDKETDGYVFNHLMLRIKDPKRSLDFYSKIMGIKSKNY